MVAVAAEHTADLVPVHSRVAVPGYDPDGCRGTISREEKCDHDSIKDAQDQSSSFPSWAEGSEAQGQG